MDMQLTPVVLADVVVEGWHGKLSGNNRTSSGRKERTNISTKDSPITRPSRPSASHPIQRLTIQVLEVMPQMIRRWSRRWKALKAPSR
jgi:hypothetical protein